MLKKMLILSVVVLMMTACTQAEKEKQKPEATPVETDSYYDEEGSKWIWEENIRWSRNENVLRIAGEGKLKRKHLKTVWNYWHAEITEVIIEEGITDIGACCFSNCMRLQKIQLPYSLKNIQKG